MSPRAARLILAQVFLRDLVSILSSYWGFVILVVVVVVFLVGSPRGRAR